jgi:cell division control protein 24
MTIGSYTCQIFWKGDPGIENFIIRFSSEDMMKKWAQQIESQRRRYRERMRNSDGSRTGGTSQTEFEFMRNQPTLENPYARPGEEDEEDESETLVSSGGPSWSSSSQAYPNGQSEFSQSRNASTSSLRSRSTTSESTGPPPSAAAQSRAPPPRMPPGAFANQPQLSLRTRGLPSHVASPAGNFVGDSYFSPAPESPMTATSRTSSSSNLYPFPRQPVPQNGYYEEGHGGTRFTAPAIGRPQPNQRDTSGSMSNGYPGAPAPRPGPRAGGASGLHSSQQLPMAHRNRSASSPDIHNAQRAATNGQQPPVPAMPANYQGFTHMAPRSQTGSPNGLPSRQPANSPQSTSDSRGGYNGPSPTSQLPYDPAARPDLRGPQYPSSRAVTPVSRTDGTSGPPSSSSDILPPTQLKVKVHAPSAAQVLTLVVPLNISYQTLKDRIDAKLQRSTNLTLGTGNGGTGGPPASKDNVVKLKYLDEDDYVTIQTDEDVLEAFETWREQRGGDLGGDGMGGMGEIELFCQR